jgi:hypothetical protein
MIILLRHCESTANKYGDNSYDVPLTKEGIKQAKGLSGYYDLVIVSPLKRALETLYNSKIKYGELLISPLCRENMSYRCSLMKGEKYFETKSDLDKRIFLFKQLLINLSHIYDKILVISHTEFMGKMTGKYLDNGKKMVYIK